MLNPNKPYYKTAKYLADNSVSKKELIAQGDKVWKIVTSFVPQDKIFFHKWTSFSNIRSPKHTGIRMRDDRFLKKSCTEKLDSTYLMMSCIKVNGKKVYFVLTSNYFTNYSYSTKSSNSFVLFDLVDDIYNWAKSPNHIEVKSRRVKGKGDQPIYHYWVGTESDADYKTLIGYVSVLSSVYNANYSVLHRKIDDKGRVAIPQAIIEQIDKRYGNLCSLLKTNKCVWSTESIKSKLLAPKAHHHIVPEEWFLEKKCRDSKIINDPNNIVLLCKNCHDKIHSADDATVKITLDNVLNMMKETNQYKQFEDYLINTVKITLPILYKIYNCKYDE